MIIKVLFCKGSGKRFRNAKAKFGSCRKCKLK